LFLPVSAILEELLSPSKVIVPLSGVSSVPSMLRSVVFPLPEAPMMVTISPSAASRLMPWRMGIGALPGSA